MMSEREHDLIVALEKLLDVSVQIPVDWTQPHAKEMAARARAAVDHARALLNRIKI